MTEISLFRWALEAPRALIKSRKLYFGVAAARALSGGYATSLIYTHDERLRIQWMHTCLVSALIFSGLFLGALIFEILRRRGLDITVPAHPENASISTQFFLACSVSTVAIYLLTLILPVWFYLSLTGCDFTAILQYSVYIVFAVAFGIGAVIHFIHYRHRQKHGRRASVYSLTE